MAEITATESTATFLERLRLDEIKYVRFELPDLHGISRSKLIPSEKVQSYARRGLNFYGSVLAMDTASVTVSAPAMGAATKYRDMLLFPDVNTLTPVPWLANTAKVICDPYNDPRDPLRIAPRYVLKRLLDFAGQLGFGVMMGHEFEFYLLDAVTKEPLFGGKHIFNTTRNNYIPAINQILDYLQLSNIDVISHNCESAPSQFEINYGPSVGIEAADKAFTFKNAVKEIAHHLGYIATFMSKPFIGKAGSGCHFHVSLIDLKTGQNVFWDQSDTDGLSKIGRSFTQGVLDHAPGLMALVAPTPNCYRRLKRRSFAPSNISYGIEDRSALIRIKASKDESTHIEVRAPSGLSNPYLTAAAVIAGGLLGVQQERDLQPLCDCLGEDVVDLPKLPQNLEESLKQLELDLEFRSLLGEEFCELFTAVKLHELSRFHEHVTEWERNEYLEVY